MHIPRTKIEIDLASEKLNKDILLFLATLAIIFVSRLPFLDAGYGNDPDAWRVINAAREIATSGEYSASRLPGYPVQEIFCSLLWRGGPLATNGVTAFLSALGIAFFVLSMKICGYKNYVVAGLTLAFTPVVFINSTNLMDYLWALAFILGSLYFVLVRRTIIAGILMGVAIGCRITSGAMLIPLCLLLADGATTKRCKIWSISVFSFTACLAGAIAFSPVFLKYGWGFFAFYDGYHPSATEIIKKFTVEVWGVVGLFAILVAIISLVFWPGKIREGITTPRSLVIAAVIAILLYIIAFLKLPHDSGYLIPIIPFVIVLIASFLRQKIFIGVCLAIAFSSFISIGRSGIYSGPIISDHANRIGLMKFTEHILFLGSRLYGKSVIVAGPSLPELEGYLFSTSQGKVEYAYLLDASQLQGYINRGFKIYFLPDQREANLGRYNIDLLKYGAKPLIPEK